ncbi:hypothetical protein [Luteococcus peritonei]|uniref:Uncharacterized protein n=1 Tax=Luteococcus peritonei TaxID=88874 RepID=A0ABW4RX04_9ACTN
MPASESTPPDQPGGVWPYPVDDEVEPEAPPRPGLVRGARATLAVLLACFVLLPFSDALGRGGPIVLGLVVFLTGCLGAMTASHARRLGLLVANVACSMLALPWFVYHIFRMIGLI